MASRSYKVAQDCFHIKFQLNKETEYFPTKYAFRPHGINPCSRMLEVDWDLLAFEVLMWPHFFKTYAVT